MEMPELWQVCLSVSNATPWLEPDLRNLPLSPFWQFWWYIGSAIGMAIFLWFMVDYILPEAHAWVRTIKPFLKRSLAEYEDWKNKRNV
jgi:hypothetical protein